MQKRPAESGLSPLPAYGPARSKETCPINQPPTDDQGRDCFYDRPANRKPECAEAEDREQNPERFCLSAQIAVQFLAYPLSPTYVALHLESRGMVLKMDQPQFWSWD